MTSDPEHSSSPSTQELDAQKAVYEQRLQERFREIAELTQIIRERDRVIARADIQVEWLRQVLSILTMSFSKSGRARFAACLPAFLGQKQQKASLKSQGLFDPEAYVKKYPDVAESKIDPLRHYINDGLREGRSVN